MRSAFPHHQRTLKQFLEAAEIVGGSNRIPKVAEIIPETFGMDISRSLNSNEAIVCGVTFTATFTSGSFKTPYITHKYMYQYKLNIVLGIRTIPSKPNLNIEKQTIRFQLLEDMSFSIEFAGKVPAGASRVIGNLSYGEIPQEGESRILFSLASNKQKFRLQQRTTKKVEKRSLSIQRTYPSTVGKKKKRCISSKRSQQKIKRPAKIAGVRNEYGKQLYGTKDNIENDETWSIIMSPDEKEDLKTLLNESYEWADC